MILTTFLISTALMFLVLALGLIGSGLQGSGLIDSALYYVATNTSGSRAVLAPIQAANAKVRWFKRWAKRDPLLIGISAMLVATPADADDYLLAYANEKRSETWSLPWHVGEGVAGKPTHWMKQPRLLSKDDTITITGLQTSGADNKVMAVILHNLYGTMPKLTKGAMEQTIAPFTADTTVAGAWTEAGIIDTLDKDANYYLLSAIVVGDTAVAIRAKADSFEGAKPAWMGVANQQVGIERLFDIPPFAMKFSGLEPLVFEVLDSAGSTTPKVFALLAKEYISKGENVPSETTEVSQPGAAGRISPGVGAVGGISKEALQLFG